MPPKVDPNSEFDIYLRVKGGVVLPAQSIAPKVGPYGLPPKLVGDKILEGTKDYKGIKVSIKLHCKQRQPTVIILPCASTQIIKALNEGPRTAPKGTAIQHNGTLPFDSVVAIAKSLRFKSYSKRFAGTVCEILGTCQSIGCSVNYKGTTYKAHDLIDQIREGNVSIEDYNVNRDEWKLI